MEYMESKMQDLMEASEHEHNELMEEFRPPDDWDRPEWEKADKVHNWRNYVSEGLQREWGSFTGRQKIMLSSAFDEMAASEHWN